jgi:hypothetical protein
MRNPTEVGHWFRRNPAALGILLGRPPVDRTTVVAAHELAVLVYFEPADADIIEAAIDKLVFSGDHVLLRRFSVGSCHACGRGRVRRLVGRF